MFLTSLRSGKPYGSPSPAQGITLSFDAATQLCDYFREQGYFTTIADRFGQPPSTADLAALKRSIEYQVYFQGQYFCGQNKNQKDLGSTDRRKAANMTEGAALVVCDRLKAKGFADAVIIERADFFVDVNDELRNIWPEEFSANNKKQ